MAIRKRPVSPRQKMINLMYVVLMAMLALNVSNEVLNGFSIVEESLNRTTSNSAKENLAIYEDFDAQMKANPQKAKEWYDKAQLVRQISDSLFNFAAELKQAIVVEADGKDGDVTAIRTLTLVASYVSVFLFVITVFWLITIIAFAQRTKPDRVIAEDRKALNEAEYIKSRTQPRYMLRVDDRPTAAARISKVQSLKLAEQARQGKTDLYEAGPVPTVRIRKTSF